MAEITIRDLLSWENRIGMPPAGHDGEQKESSNGYLDREVTWAVTLRASMPILPPIRGGEVVILPDRILADSGVAVGEIVREVASRGATGLVVERLIQTPPSLVMLWSEVIPADLESDINRVLTEQRGEIYRVGTELGRVLTQVNALGADIEEVLRASGSYLGVNAAVVSPRDGTLATHGSSLERIAPGLPTGVSASGWHEDCYGSSLSNGNTLWLGPVPPARRAMARLVSERIGMAVDAALAHAVDVRPRGSARAHALAGLLTDGSSESTKVGAALGLPSNGVFVVAMADAGINRLNLQRELSSLGSIHDAADVDGFATALIESPMRARKPLIASQTSAFERRPGVADIGDPEHWVVMSEPVTGVARIPAAARQARFLAALVSAGMLAGPLLRFDRPADAGVYRLLFPLWGSPELDGFARDTLGRLISRDKRGTLRRTLLAYLESGGSQVDASAKLGVHRNTLAYRLKQITELAGVDPTKPHSHLALHMALLASVLPPAPGGA